MDQSAALELGYPYEGDPGVPGEAADADAGRGGDVPSGAEGEPVPQPPGVRLPQHGAGVVVAVRAGRLPEHRVSGRVDGRARQRAPVFAGAAGTSGPAPQLRAVGPDALGVDRAEARRGEGGEQARVPGDGLRYAFAAGQAGADELVGVAAVDR